MATHGSSFYSHSGKNHGHSHASPKKEHSHKHGHPNKVLSTKGNHQTNGNDVDYGNLHGIKSHSTPINPELSKSSNNSFSPSLENVPEYGEIDHKKQQNLSKENIKQKDGELDENVNISEGESSMTLPNNSIFHQQDTSEKVERVSRNTVSSSEQFNMSHIKNMSSKFQQHIIIALKLFGNSVLIFTVINIPSS